MTSKLDLVAGGSLWFAMVGGCSVPDLSGSWDISLDPDPTDCAGFLDPDEFEPGERGAADFTPVESCFFCEIGTAIWVGRQTTLAARLAPPDAELPAGTTLSLVSDDTSVLEVVDTQFVDDAPRCSADVRATVRAVAPGDASLQLVDAEGLVLDRHAYPVRAVATIDVGQQVGTTTTRASVALSDGVVILMATARSDDGLAVWTGGAMQWSVDDPQILDFSDDAQGEPVDRASGHLVMLSLHSEGRTTVRVRIGEVETTIDVEVEPATVPPTGA